jgi:hypothetical protein
MNDIARQLRAQIPSSTDPDRLERLACEAESAAEARRPRIAARQWLLARCLTHLRGDQ